MRIILITLIAFFISSCATMSKDECLVADWNRVGYQDAVDGKAVKLAGHSKACAKVNIRPNQEQYMQGYRSGEKVFCTYENGLEMGEKGRSISRICNAPELRDEFITGHQHGTRIHDKQEEVDKKKRLIADIEKKITTTKQSNSANATTEIDLLYREKELINKEIFLLSNELDSLKNQYRY